jgi:hypothetical protein
MMALGLISATDLKEAGLTLTDLDDSTLVGRTATSVHTGVARRDVLFQADKYFDNGLMHPGHLIAVDHAEKAVVLAIRGTSNFDVRTVDIQPLLDLCFLDPHRLGSVSQSGLALRCR